MATLTAVAGGGNWSAGATWTGGTGVAPTAADDVLITAAMTGTITIDGTAGSPNLCRSLNCTGNLTGTLSHAASKQLNVGDGTAGVFTLVSAITYAPASTSILKFVSTTTGNNITWAAKNIGPVTFDGVGGAWQLQDNNGTTNSPTWTLTNGSLDTNGKAVGGLLSSNNSNTRSLTLGATTWTIPANQGGTVWDIGTSTGMTLSAASSTITSATTTNSQAFSGGGLTYGTVSFTALTTGTVTINGANTEGTLTLNQGASTTGSYLIGADQTVTGTFTSNGNSVINRSYIRSTVRGTARTISAATFTFTNIDLQDITKAGAGSGNISAITGGSGDCGGNTGWTFNTPKNCFMKTAVSVNWSASNWFTTTGGSTPISPVIPLVQDTAIFDANSVTAGSKTITTDVPRICAVNWTGVLNTPAWAKTTVFSFFGAVTMVSGMTNSGTTATTYEGRGNSTFTTGTQTWTNPLTIDSVNSVGTLTQGDNFASSSTLTGTSGAFTGASTFTTSFTTATWNGGTMTMTGNMTLTGAFSVTGGAFGNGTGVVTGGTTASWTGGTTNIKGFSGTTVVHGAGAVTIGSSGIAGSSFSKNGSGTMTINGASTFSGAMTLSSTGIWNINANVTGSSTLAQTGQTVNISNATLAYNNGSYASSGAAGMLFIPNLEAT